MRTTFRAVIAGSAIACGVLAGAALAAADAPRPGSQPEVADSPHPIGTGSTQTPWYCQFGSSSDPACFLPYYD